MMLLDFFVILVLSKSFRNIAATSRKYLLAANDNIGEREIPLDREPPLKIALLVEPTPFGYISGYANRFKEMLTFLKKANDEVEILTPDDSPNPLAHFLGYKINTVHGFRFPFYNAVTLSFDVKGKTAEILSRFKPDLLHVSSPGSLVFPAVFYARKFNVPLVMSYHTHLPLYAKSYIGLPGATKFAEFLVRTVHNRADLTLVTSPQLKEELEALGVKRVDVWQKGINYEVR